MVMKVYRFPFPPMSSKAISGALGTTRFRLCTKMASDTGVANPLENHLVKDCGQGISLGATRHLRMAKM